MTNQEEIVLQVETRQPGKHWSRSLRSNKKIPAVVYGPHIENMNFCLSEVDAVRYSPSKFDNTIFTLKSTEGNLNGLKVLKKEMVNHPVNQRPRHIDFYALDMSKAVRVSVKLKFVGKPVGLMEGGITQEIQHDIEIECPATDIPSEFEVNVESLKLGDVLHVSDVVLGKDSYKLISGEEEAIFSVVQPREEEPEPVTAAEGAEGEAAAGEGGAAAAEGDKKEDGDKS